MQTFDESDPRRAGVENSSGMERAVGRALRQLQQLGELFQKLPAECTGRDKAGNRQLDYAHYAGLVLLSMFTPAISSLRDIQRASELKKVRQALTPQGRPPAGRVSLGSLSESVRVFDPELLQPLMQELASRLPKGRRFSAAHEIPPEVLEKLVAVDGSNLKALAQIIGAQFSGGSSGEKLKVGWRLHLQYRVANDLPRSLGLTEEAVGGKTDERSVLQSRLESGVIYIGDRGYERYALFNAIVAAQSDYVIRVQRRSVSLVEQRELSEQAQAAGVIEDAVVQAGGSRADCPAIDHPVRRVVIAGGVPQGPPRSTAEQRSEEVVLMTNLRDVPAEVIAAVYRLRWRIEVFFRFFKHVLGVRHLFSSKPEGVLIQVYCALIAALLLAQICERNVSRGCMQMIELYLAGWAEEDEVLAALQREAAKKTK